MQTAPHAMLWGSTSLRKHAMELAALQLDRFPHHAVNGQVAMQCFNTGNSTPRPQLACLLSRQWRAYSA